MKSVHDIYILKKNTYILSSKIIIVKRKKEKNKLKKTKHLPIFERKIQTALSGSGIVGGCALFTSVTPLLVAEEPPGRVAPGATIPTVPYAMARPASPKPNFSVIVEVLSSRS